jgi:hypothetical protein
LACDEKTEIKAFAAFQLPGVYDVNRWKLTVRTHEREEEVFVHQPSLPQLVTTVNV